MPPSVVDLPWLPVPPPDFPVQCRLIGKEGQVASDIQLLAGYRLSTRQSSLLSRAIKRCRSSCLDLIPLSNFRLGILSSGTFELLLDCLPAAAARHGVDLELISTPYDQVMQQALDRKSAINTARLDGVLVAVDHRWLKLDRAALNGTPSAAVTAAVKQLRTIVEGLHTYSRSPAVLQTLPAPPQTLFGSYDRRMRGAMRAMIDEANRAIVELAGETSSYLLDVAALAERVGTDYWFDTIQWVSYKLPFAAEFFPIYSDMLARLIGSIRGKTRKCLVLDLDNTIWGGVIGDDGLAGIRIGQGDARGESFLDVQRTAIELYDRGVILAVCSKNDDAVARSPFREHPEMALREAHIAVFQANWIDKPSNLESIANALNIGLDSLVLLDDSPVERAQVRASLPMVAVPELPNEPSWFAWYLTAPGYFEAVAFSDEDRQRAEYYGSNARRAEVMASTRNIEEYLTSLDMVINFCQFSPRARQRIAQLINKTNQFNLTTRRYTEAEIAEMESDESILTLQVRLADRFGDLGMISVVICRPAEGNSLSWQIDTWLMSCRVLGRQVEQAVLLRLVMEAKKRGVRQLIGTYIATLKNAMVSEHYETLGFQQIGVTNGSHTVWELKLSEYRPPKLPMRVEDELSSFIVVVEPS